MKGNSLTEWLVKLIFFLMLLPSFISLALQVIALIFQAIIGFFLAIVPWLIGLALLIGLAAGISAGLTMRRRLPTENRYQLPPAEYGNYPPYGMTPARRPRATRQVDEE